MASEVQLVPARLEHAFVLATTMRPKDVAELQLAGLTPLDGLLQSLRSSAVACALLHDDEVGAMFGVEKLDGPVLGRVDRLWFLTGHLFAERPLAFTRAVRRALAVLRRVYPVLTNHIDARHDDALRFAKTMGARLLPAVPFGPAGASFVPFVIGRT